jgi:hypothetical protein
MAKNPLDWPREAARSNADLNKAIDELVAGIDEANMRHAIREFIKERLAFVTSTLI